MKRKMLLFITFGLVLLLIPLFANADIVDSGECGNGVIWTLDDEGVLTVSGSGHITSNPWSDLDIKKVVIKSGVKSICDGAFQGKGMASVELPDTMEEIGVTAFAFCGGLSKVNIPKSIKSYGYGVFAGCGSLTDVTLEEGLTSIGGQMFRWCGFGTINIPESVTKIDYSAFSDCSKLKEVTIPGNVTELGYESFSGCTELTNVYISEGVPYIGGEAFSGCKSLQSVTFPQSMISIDGAAFNNCYALTTIVFKGNTRIAGDAFNHCYELSSITLPACNDSTIQWFKDNGYEDALNITPHTLSKKEKVEPTCIDTGIDAYWTCNLCGKMFSDEAGQTEITEPIEIPALGHNWKKPTYEWAEDYSQVTASHICKRDETHTETETVKTTSVVKQATYTKDGKITYTAVFENPAFKKQTKKVVIPKLPVDIKLDGNKYHLDPKKKTATFTGVEKKNAAAIIIPDTITDNGKTFKVTEIAANACKGLSKLKSVSIGKNVKTIGANAFNKCRRLARIFVKTIKLTDKTVGSNAFSGVYKEVVFKCPKSKLKAYTKLFLAKGAPSKATFIQIIKGGII